MTRLAYIFPFISGFYRISSIYLISYLSETPSDSILNFATKASCFIVSYCFLVSLLCITLSNIFKAIWNLSISIRWKDCQEKLLTLQVAYAALLAGVLSVFEIYFCALGLSDHKMSKVYIITSASLGQFTISVIIGLIFIKNDTRKASNLINFSIPNIFFSLFIILAYGMSIIPYDSTLLYTFIYEFISGCISTIAILKVYRLCSLVQSLWLGCFLIAIVELIVIILFFVIFFKFEIFNYFLESITILSENTKMVTLFLIMNCGFYLIIFTFKSFGSKHQLGIISIIITGQIILCFLCQSKFFWNPIQSVNILREFVPLTIYSFTALITILMSSILIWIATHLNYKKDIFKKKNRGIKIIKTDDEQFNKFFKSYMDKIKLNELQEDMTKKFNTIHPKTILQSYKPCISTVSPYETTINFMTNCNVSNSGDLSVSNAYSENTSNSIDSFPSNNKNCMPQQNDTNIKRNQTINSSYYSISSSAKSMVTVDSFPCSRVEPELFQMFTFNPSNNTQIF